MFRAAGQHASYRIRTLNIGIEEYELSSDIVVKAVGQRKDVLIKAALLVCITNYWLKSRKNKVSNATHLASTARWRLGSNGCVCDCVLRNGNSGRWMQLYGTRCRFSSLRGCSTCFSCASMTFRPLLTYPNVCLSTSSCAQSHDSESEIIGRVQGKIAPGSVY